MAMNKKYFIPQFQNVIASHKEDMLLDMQLGFETIQSIILLWVKFIFNRPIVAKPFYEPLH